MGTVTMEETRTRKTGEDSRTAEDKKIFVCRNCGKIVVVGAARDKQKVFCSGHCARQYWRKPKSVQEKRMLQAREIEENLFAALKGQLAETSERQ